MRSFGRSCRGQGKVFVKLVRQTEQQLLEVGETISTLAQQAQASLQQTTTLSETQRTRLSEHLTTAVRHHEQLRKQSKQLTQGKKLAHCKVVNAYDPTIAPIMKGKSNCPAQFGRKPGIISEPATGYIFANLTPQGNPSDESYVLPLIDKVEQAIGRVHQGPGLMQRGLGHLTKLVPFLFQFLRSHKGFPSLGLNRFAKRVFAPSHHLLGANPF
jgi:hypothetical protein